MKSIFITTNKTLKVFTAALCTVFEGEVITIKDKALLSDITEGSIVVVTEDYRREIDFFELVYEKSCTIIAIFPTLNIRNTFYPHVALLSEYPDLSLLEEVKMNLDLRRDSDNSTFLKSKNTKMLSLLESVEIVRNKFISVHIEGEVGSGKTSLAKQIAGKRKFVYINCATLNSLAMDQLFGHVKGAFTGADKDRDGALKTANGGVLFLDEIQDLPYEAQTYLLRVLDDGSFRPIGSDKELKVKVQLITASSKSFEELKHLIRFDLISRIGIVKLRIPPLRERKEDIEDLVKFKLKELRKAYGSGNVVENEKFWCTYDWPGNIRELFAKVEYTYVTGKINEELSGQKKVKVVKDRDEKDLLTALTLEEILNI